MLVTTLAFAAGEYDLGERELALSALPRSSDNYEESGLTTIRRFTHLQKFAAEIYVEVPCPSFH